MGLKEQVRTRIRERIKSEFHSLSPRYQRYLTNKWEAEGVPVPSLTPATPPVDLRPVPVHPGTRVLPVCNTQKPTAPTKNQTDRPSPVPGNRRSYPQEPERKSAPIPTDWGTEDEALREFWDMVSRVSRIRR